MPTLYILGAGCSTNYDQCTSPVPGLKPPLNSDFFAMAKKVIDQYGLVNMYSPIIGLGHFIRNLNRLYGYGNSEEDTTVLNDPRLTLEGVMNHFYLEHRMFDRFDLLSSETSNRVRTLNDLLAYVLAESMTGPPCRRHARLARMMKKGDVVWNFNYDILMDNALSLSKKLTDSGYIMRFDYTLVDGRWRMTEDTRSQVTMLKLHGSLNWLKCNRCGRNFLLRHEKSVRAFWQLVGEERSGSLLVCAKCQSDRWSGLERIIVPPAGLKDVLYSDIGYLWQTAPSLCSRIERIVVIGYRFSELDFELEVLLRTLTEHGTLRSSTPITIVDTAPDHVRNRFASIFDRSRIGQIPSLDEFLHGSHEGD